MLFRSSSCSQCRMCTDLCPRNRLGHKVEPHKVMNAFANGMLSHYDGIETALGCCGCNLCSYFSCHHELSPGTLMTEVKKELLKGGIKGVASIMPPNEAQYIKVPSTRIIDRIGLRKYNQHAYLEDEPFVVRYVYVPLSQHIGMPAVATVKVGDVVQEGQLIGRANEKGLSTNIHSSIEGVVRRLTDKEIIIERRA